MPYSSILLAVVVTVTSAASADDMGAKQGTREATHSVVIQPILVCDGCGQNPARMRIMEPLIDQVYAKAGIDFHFLEPIRYHCREARDGEINLDQIVRESRQAGVLRGEGSLINMFFVNAVDGHQGPLGRGQQNGSILFICLGDKPNPAMEAFVVAHEAGHNLNLRHAVDDENVPNDIPNLMGDGPFEKRVGPEGLTDYQISEIHKSRLVKKRILCLNVEEARRAIVDESFEPYFSQLQRPEIAALTAAVPTSETLDDCRREARRRFRDAVLPFTDREVEALSFLVKRLESRVCADYPLLARQPWRFVKTANHLCGGFAWTRGLNIFLSKRMIDAILASRIAAPPTEFLETHGPLMLHEKMHVLQRVYPSRFVSLYTEVFGFAQAKVEPSPWLTERQIINPDGIRMEWLFQTDRAAGQEKYIWPRTVLKTTDGVPKMGKDFQLLAAEVQQHHDGWRIKSRADGSPVCDLEALEMLAHRFTMKNGLDHPNEIAAYLLPRLVLAEAESRRVPDASADTESAVSLEIKRRFAAWCCENLR